tara:strand:- start:390 stop:776 length:387 start_codon:yes stop_codon:yes gene_type:complete
MSKKTIYRSGLESVIAQALAGHGFKYEPFSVPYVTHRKYTPDFVKGKYLIEAKGFFRAGDTMKYKAIRDCIDGELIFILSDPYRKVRKGSKMSMGQWCEKEGIAYFGVPDIDKLLKYIGDKDESNSDT